MNETLVSMECRDILNLRSEREMSSGFLHESTKASCIIHASRVDFELTVGPGIYATILSSFTNEPAI